MTYFTSTAEGRDDPLPPSGPSESVTTRATPSDTSRPSMLYLISCILVVTILGPLVPASVAVVASILYWLPQSPSFDVVNWALIQQGSSALRLAYGVGGPIALIAGTVLAFISRRNGRIRLRQIVVVVAGAFIAVCAPSAVDLVLGTMKHAVSESVVVSNALYIVLVVPAGIAVSVLVALLFWRFRKILGLRRAIDGR